MFGGNAFGWPYFAGFVPFLKHRVRSGGAGGAWRSRRKPKLLTPDDVRRLLERETGILVHEITEEEEIAILQMLGWL